MDIILLNTLLITACTFGTITLVVIIIIRTKQLSGDTQKVNRRLEFWLSEKANVQQSMLGDESLSREKSFTKGVLIPLGEQVGHWMADKVSYSSKESKRLILIKAGIRAKNAITIFYGLKLVCAILFFIVGLIVLPFDTIQKKLGVSMALGGFGFLLLNIILDKLAEARRKNIDRVLPDALDLLVICTEAGMGIDQSLLRVASNLGRGGKELQEEIVLTNREMSLGQDRHLCWKNLGERSTSEELKNLAGIIIQTEKAGSQIAQVLRDQSDFLRMRKRQKAEETAAQMTIKMMVPMVLFIFPCILAVTLGPPVLKIIAAFSKF